MREFTKSMMSYTWAMSLFGVQQMVNVFRPSKASESFENVTKATEDEFGDAMKAAFRAGDNLQRGLVDLTFGVFTFGMFDRGGSSRSTGDVGRQTAEAMRQGMRAAGQAADAVGQTMQGAASAAASMAQQGAGWAGAQNAGRDARTAARPSAPGGAQYTRPPDATGGPTEGRTPGGAAGGGQTQQQGWGPMPTQASGSYASRK